MQTIFPSATTHVLNANHSLVARESNHYRFCSGRCQSERPTEGGVELAPGRWRCMNCWMAITRKRG